VTVADVVGGIETSFDAGPILVAEQLHRQLDGHGVLLADIAHVGGAADRDIRRGDAAPPYRLAAFVLHRPANLFHPAEGRSGEWREPGADEVAAQIGDQHAKSREMPRGNRDHYPADAQFAGDHRGVQRPGAAIGD
jgi:hypothetical protein